MGRISEWFRRAPDWRGQGDTQLLHAASEQGAFGSGAVALRPLEESLFGWLLSAEFNRLQEADRRSPKIEQRLTRRLRHSGLKELPRRPSVLPRLMSAIGQPNSRRGEITGIILSDSSLTAQVLETANTPQFGVREKTITSVEQAVFVLGEQGIHDVVSAAVMKPLMNARNNQEAAFVRRSWRWGLACAHASELTARHKVGDAQGYFLVALLPALAYITLFRESRQLLGQYGTTGRPSPALVYQMLTRLGWETVQQIAALWDLPANSHAWLLAAERPPSDSSERPLNDGIILGTREVLQYANRASLSEQALQKAVNMEPGPLAPIQRKVQQIIAR